MLIGTGQHGVVPLPSVRMTAVPSLAVEPSPRPAVAGGAIIGAPDIGHRALDRAGRHRVRRREVGTGRHHVHPSPGPDRDAAARRTRARDGWHERGLTGACLGRGVGPGDAGPSLRLDPCTSRASAMPPRCSTTVASSSSAAMTSGTPSPIWRCWDPATGAIRDRRHDAGSSAVRLDGNDAGRRAHAHRGRRRLPSELRHEQTLDLPGSRTRWGRCSGIRTSKGLSSGGELHLDRESARPRPCLPTDGSLSSGGTGEGGR